LLKAVKGWQKGRLDSLILRMSKLLEFGSERKVAACGGIGKNATAVGGALPALMYKLPPRFPSLLAPASTTASKHPRPRLT